MAASVTLNICHLYPDLMDTYGDRGNIIALTQRCRWRGIETKVSAISENDQLNPDIYDIYFFGGGQDRQQIIVGKDLQKKARAIITEVENGAVLLSICGGYQLLQKYFKTQEGKIIKGIGLFDAYTHGSTERMIGNLLIEINPDLQSEINSIYQATEQPNNHTDQLVGFENHSGKSYLGKSTKPLGTVLKGFGNNDEDKTEGAIYKNAFGCYLHGSLLPKNPHFADYLISKALDRHYGEVKLKPIDDEIEWKAHQSAINRTRSTN